MRAKQTLKVDQILEWANTQLKRTDEVATEEFKMGISTMIERILLDAGQYNGYMPLDREGSEWSRTYYMKGSKNL
jgi:Zn/Cd-binding protein ZinT